MRENEYALYFANPSTNERHHMVKGELPEDLCRIGRRARWILEDAKAKVGGHWQRHGSKWATGLEVWMTPLPYDENSEPFQPPCKLLARASWGELDLTYEPGVDRKLFYDEFDKEDEKP